MPEIQHCQVRPVKKRLAEPQQESSMGSDTLFRVVVLVLGTIPVALVAAGVLISPP